VRVPRRIDSRYSSHLLDEHGRRIRRILVVVVDQNPSVEPFFIGVPLGGRGQWSCRHRQLDHEFAPSPMFFTAGVEKSAVSSTSRRAVDGAHGVATATNQFEAGAYRSERISQFVRQDRQELVLSSICFPQPLLGAGAFDGLPGTPRSVCDEFDLLCRPVPP
jgi:hypothetical protein